MWVLQCVAVCLSVLQCVALRCNILCQSPDAHRVGFRRAYCVRHTATHWDTLRHTATLTATHAAYCVEGERVLHVVCCSVLQCVAVCCSVLQCVAECCSVSHSFDSPITIVLISGQLTRYVCNQNSRRTTFTYIYTQFYWFLWMVLHKFQSCKILQNFLLKKKKGLFCKEP